MTPEAAAPGIFNDSLVVADAVGRFLPSDGVMDPLACPVSMLPARLDVRACVPGAVRPSSRGRRRDVVSAVSVASTRRRRDAALLVQF